MVFPTVDKRPLMREYEQLTMQLVTWVSIDVWVKVTRVIVSDVLSL